MHARVWGSGDPQALSGLSLQRYPLPISRLFPPRLRPPSPGPGSLQSLLHTGLGSFVGWGRERDRERGTHLPSPARFPFPANGSSPSPAKEQRGGAAAVATRSAPGPPALEPSSLDSKRQRPPQGERKKKNKKRTGKQLGKRPGPVGALAGRREKPARFARRRRLGRRRGRRRRASFIQRRLRAEDRRPWEAWGCWSVWLEGFLFYFIF